MINTPGIYYVISYFLSSCLYISMNPLRLRGRELAGAVSCYLVLLAAFILATDGIERIFFVPCMIFEFSMICAAFFICCECSWEKAVYFGIRSFMLGEFAASLEWQLYYYGVNHWGFDKNIRTILFMLLVCHGCVFGLLYLLEKRYREENAALKIGWRELFITACWGLFIFILSNISYVLKNTPFSSELPDVVFTIRTLADMCGVGILFAYHMQLQELNAKVEKEFLENLLEMQYENFQISAESVELVNQKYHDLKHQIMILRSATDSAEKNSYLDRMEEEIRSYEAQNKTGNKVLDAILTTKNLQCQRRKISLTCVADGKVLDFMEAMDISALFGNALDNAIEGTDPIADPQKRLIHLSVNRQKNFVLIRLENCYEGNLNFENGLPVTTKGDRKFHGFGTRSIRQIAVKYGGSMTVQAENGWFALRVLIPVNQFSQS